MLAAVVAAAWAADVAAFDGRAASLESELAAYRAQGMPARLAAPIEAQLELARDRRWSGIPYAAYSAAAVRDPFAAEEMQARAAQAEWRREQSAQRVDAMLADVSGGLVDGAPSDLFSLSVRLDGLLGSAHSVGVDATPGPDALRIVAASELLPSGRQLSMHLDLLDTMHGAMNTVQARVTAKKQALVLLDQARTLLGDAEWLGTSKPGDEDAVAAAAAAVGRARLDAQIAAATKQLGPLLDRLAKEANSEMPQPLPNGPCLSGAPPKLIWIHLVTQELIAYQNGCPKLATWVTTGRPALPTGRGRFRIFYKARDYLMHSPWPYWSEYWYPDTWVAYAMEFIGDGTFIHTADWEPPGAYGRGSEYGPYASHGCVHVQDGPAAKLFAWAPIGTAVIVGD